MCFIYDTVLSFSRSRTLPGCVPRINAPLLAAEAAAEAAAELEPRPLDAAAAEAAAATAPQLPPASKHQHSSMVACSSVKNKSMAGSASARMLMQLYIEIKHSLGL